MVLDQVLEALHDRLAGLMERAGAGIPVVDDGSAGMMAVGMLAVPI